LEDGTTHLRPEFLPGRTKAGRQLDDRMGTPTHQDTVSSDVFLDADRAEPAIQKDHIDRIAQPDRMHCFARTQP